MKTTEISANIYLSQTVPYFLHTSTLLQLGTLLPPQLQSTKLPLGMKLAAGRASQATP